MSSLTKLVIFDFDGTLFDTHESIAHTLAITFTHLLPPNVPSPSEAAIATSISGGLSLLETISQLYPASPNAPAPDEALLEKFIIDYRSLYKTHGNPLIKPFPHIHELLTELRARSIPCAIVSNKGIVAVRDILAANHLSSLIELVVGDGEPANCPRKPDPGSWTVAVKPAFEQQTGTQAGIGELKGEHVLVVGDTETDIMYARNIGARSVWCSYGYGTKEKCIDLKPEFVVRGLDDIIKVL